MLGLLSVGVPLSMWGALYPSNTYLQVGPVILLLLVAVPALRKWPLTDASVGCMFAFLLLHLVGARWSYSFVPYDDALESLTGLTLNATFGFSRNHFDRLVHFSFGLLAVVPVQEIAKTYFKFSHRAAVYLALEFVLALSAVYEIFEWLLAVFMDAKSADAYNGQQGDMFDGQKDMLLAFSGAIVAALFAKREVLQDSQSHLGSLRSN
jgi:putative membrane protein